MDENRSRLEPDAVAAQFGRALRRTREAAEFTQERLAGLAGVDRVYISEIERGRKSPTLRVVAKLAWATRQAPSELLLAAEELARAAARWDE